MPFAKVDLDRQRLGARHPEFAYEPAGLTVACRTRIRHTSTCMLATAPSVTTPATVPVTGEAAVPRRLF